MLDLRPQGLTQMGIRGFTVKRHMPSNFSLFPCWNQLVTYKVAPLLHLEITSQTIVNMYEEVSKQHHPWRIRDQTLLL